MVQDMGNINLRALEVYEEVEKEYNSLLGKKEKLDLERQDVVGMIDELEGKKKDLFLDTLKVINENFQNIFSSLTQKGEAELDLEDPENPFEAGLKVRVRLTGTKFLDIRSLSGGEKTLTALAFIFSIQEHSPASFYVLDEVDAALDKHNSDKLAKLIRKYVDKAQYIMISHNDGIISEADNLFGISMNEHGISKITSLKI
jgi:chromosome segregation protein